MTIELDDLIGSLLKIRNDNAELRRLNAELAGGNEAVHALQLKLGEAEATIAAYQARLARSRDVIDELEAERDRYAAELNQRDVQADVSPEPAGRRRWRR